MTQVKDIRVPLSHYSTKLSNRFSSIYAWPDLEIDPFVLVQKMSLVDAATMMDFLPETKHRMTDFCYNCAKVAIEELKKVGSNLANIDLVVLEQNISKSKPFHHDISTQLNEIASRYPDESKEKYFVDIVQQINESKYSKPLYPSSISAAFTLEVLIKLGVSRLDADTRITGILTESLKNILQPAVADNSAPTHRVGVR